MFTGIVAGTGRIGSIRRRADGCRLEIVSPFRRNTLKRGESIAVNGCCLTVSAKDRDGFYADLSKETLKRTNLADLKIGTPVNLERPVSLSTRLGGHLVQGHVDGVGKILSCHRNGNGMTMVIRFPRSLRRYMIPKGSIAVDGISMTVNRLKSDRFSLVVVPHTLKRTNLKDRQAGEFVNLEVDMVGKYIVNFMRSKGRRDEIKS